VIEDWRKHYNEVRPHYSLGYKTPTEWVQQLKNDLSTEATFQTTVV
jgi:putative transposase